MKLGTAKGERRQIQIGAVTLEVARREARQVLGRVEAGGDPRADVRSAKLEKARAQTSTLGAFIETVYQPEVLAHLADGNGTALRFKKVWKPLFGVPLADLAETDVARILAKRKAQGIEAGTLHRDFAVLRAALRYAVKKKIITAMPMTSDKPAPIAGRKMAPKRRVRFLSDEPGPNGELSERDRFLVTLAGERNLFVATVTTLALATGMRRANHRRHR